mgnify:FL=1
MALASVKALVVVLLKNLLNSGLELGSIVLILIFAESKNDVD